MKLKKLVGDKNKSIINYFPNEETAVKYIQEKIANPKRFELHELKGMISELLSKEDSETTKKNKTATQLLNEIGYSIIKTKSLDHLKSLNFESWFEPGDKWCKYQNANRWKNYDIYIISKDNAKSLKPMKDPKVGDDYSLSLISVGVSEGHIFQICQRYNHSANGSADWALNGNLNNLIDGLVDAFCYEFGYQSIGKKFKYMPESTIFRHGKYIRYNYEINDVYFYESGVVTAQEFLYTDTEKYTIVDYFVIDWKNKKVINPSNITDGFFEPLQDALTNGRLTITKEK